MDKQALKRRNKLLKKNKERMDILMGISKAKDTEKKEDEPKIENSDNDKNQEDDKLKNSNPDTINEINTSPAKVPNSDTTNDIGTCSTQTKDNANKICTDNEEKEKTTKKNDDKENASQNPDTQKDKKSDPTNSEKDNAKKDDTNLTQDNDKKEKSNLRERHTKEKKHKDIDKTNDNTNKLNNKDNNETKENENTMPIKIDGKKQIQFIILIICSMLISLLKRKFYDTKKIVYIDKSFINKKMIFRFLDSKFFLIFFSFLYNILFSLVDIRSYLKKENMAIYQLIENIKNIKKKFKNESDALFFLLNNGSTFSIFFVSIIKSYILFMFLTHLFDDILHSYSVFTYTPIFQEENIV
ncbi:conserved Plasmodium protein, unknown function [Plasmodium vinckei vinckei]|uniref:Uncharacterized protein n=1 Tax=Plasmodium vinckei vinckei TaxID=54757 RepID=A0A081IA12_PLAVN|nr:conserved Plasmodium protein, unknown function [Plasmodium vinckei vinckei]KEG00520.1 hypothetical protein YYE_04704 [Plasmodium vinckei vinckei]VEV54860.1 conserved Plasmodium protein, unknown function [Plasmodium vinckei vinckei]